MLIEVFHMASDPLIINKRGEDGNKIITVRILEKTLNKLDDLAAKSNRSRNELINIILAYRSTTSNSDNVSIHRVQRTHFVKTFMVCSRLTCVFTMLIYALVEN